MVIWCAHIDRNSLFIKVVSHGNVPREGGQAIEGSADDGTR